MGIYWEKLSRDKWIHLLFFLCISIKSLLDPSCLCSPQLLRWWLEALSITHIYSILRNIQALLPPVSSGGFQRVLYQGFSPTHFECKAKAQSRSAAFTGINPSAIKRIQHVIALIITRLGCIHMNVLYAEILMGNQKGSKPSPQFARDFRLGATAATWVSSTVATTIKNKGFIIYLC